MIYNRSTAVSDVIGAGSIMGFLNYTFDWSVLWRHPYGNLFIKGIFTTIHLSLLAWMIAVVL
ncbi:MAG: hypothetical protein WC202_12975 [Desulfobacterales bacterium]